MNSILHNALRAFVAPSILPVLALGMTSCGPGDRVEITGESVYSEHRRPPLIDVPSANRFAKPPTRTASAGPASGPGLHFHWETPEGWREAEPTPFSTASFEFGPQGEGACSLSLIGGSLFDNANRWRNQMGLNPYKQDEFIALQQFDILGQQATFVRLEGAFTARGKDPKPDYQLLGMMLELNGTGVYVKMVGPAQLVTDEVTNFINFVGSLQAEADGAHGGDTVAGAAPSGVELPPDHPPVAVSSEPAPTADSSGGAASGQGYAWEAPEGWLRGPERNMRLVTYGIGQASEAYVTPLGGEAGGELANINRWLGQFGQPDISQAELDAMARVSVLDKEVAFLEVSGTSKSMRGVATPDQTMLGAAYSSPSGSLFVRLTGPSVEVAGQRDAFLEFCASLTRSP